MPLLRARVNNEELKDNKVNLDFAPYKDVVYELINPSSTDPIDGIEFLTTLPREAYDIIELPRSLQPTEIRRAVIRYKTQELLLYAEKIEGTELEGKGMGSFSYTRDRKILV